MYSRRGAPQVLRSTPLLRHGRIKQTHTQTHLDSQLRARCGWWKVVVVVVVVVVVCVLVCVLVCVSVCVCVCGCVCVCVVQNADYVPCNPDCLEPLRQISG